MKAGHWDDLTARLVSGGAMVLVGLIGVWIGGQIFHVLIALICGGMVWELVRMVDADRIQTPRVLGLASAGCVFLAGLLPPAFGLPLLMVPSLLGLGRMQTGGVTYAVFTALILLAGFGMMAVRDDYGLPWMAWLVLVVVVTDVAGYFVGRAVGGPKLWPRVSPKKTWSGSAGGWAGAAIVGLLFAGATQAGLGLIGVSIAVSIASQIGDIAESAIKRRAGVKDSSNLIPGHGGLLDRFDGMLGAALFILIAGSVIGFPAEGP